MHAPPATVAAELIDCIAQGRLPSNDELHRVADHIWSDLQGANAAFAWGGPQSSQAEQVVILRTARAALIGTSDSNI